MIGVLSSYYHKNIVACIEDDVLARARRGLDSHIYAMKKQFGTQMASFPEIK